MAKDSTTTTLDEELYAGLQQARKKKALNFCLIAKGQKVKKLILQKKKIATSLVTAAKSETGGNLIIEGVVIGEGVELTFEVTGEEPSITPMKLKEFIADQAELTLKPRWSVVKELREVQDDDAVPVAPPVSPPKSTGAPQQTPPVAPPTLPTDDSKLLADLADKMKQLKPAVQSALEASPARKDELLASVAAFKQHVKDGSVSGARSSLAEVVKLIKELGGAPRSETQPAPQAEDPAYTKAKARFAAARGTWIKVKDQAVTNIHAIRDGMVAEYKDVPEVKDNLARGVKELNEVAAKFNDELKLKFDEFTADPPPPPEHRERIQREALALIEGYRAEIESNSIYEDLDQREFAPVLVKAPLLQALTGLAKDLAS